tara:strand:- start:79 stop:1224 length:1146 start_codon:yes stop_codon:yes gene_type:complete
MNIQLGIVQGTKNKYNQNSLEIMPYGPKRKSIDATFASPFGGAGYGMVYTPSKGSLVLYLDFVKTEEVPFDYIWFSCVFDPTQPVFTDTHTEVDQLTAEGVARNQVEYEGKQKGKAYINPIPENANLFTDDGHNDSFLLKSKTGHRFKMAHKVTDQRNEDSIELTTAGNKMIRFDDGHQDGIFIQDDKADDPNRREIFTGQDKIRDYSNRDIESISKAGSHTTAVLDGSGDIYRENQADGDIFDMVYGNGKEEKGNYLLDTNYNISRYARTGDIIESCDEGNTTQYTKIDHTITVDRHAITTIAENYTIDVGGDMSTTVGGDTSLDSVGSITITTSSFLKMEAATNMDITAGGVMSIHSNGPMVISSNSGIVIQAPRVDII